MTGVMPEIGSKISLISKADIRYEGRLYTVDPQECTIALASGKFFIFFYFCCKFFLAFLLIILFELNCYLFEIIKLISKLHIRIKCSV